MKKDLGTKMFEAMGIKTVDVTPQQNLSEQVMEKYSTGKFISEYMNDHNGGTPRWLRGAFFDEKEKIEKILEYMQGIESGFSSTLQSIEQQVLGVVGEDEIYSEDYKCGGCGECEACLLPSRKTDE